MESTLVIVKPDAVQRGLIGRIVSRLEDKGLRIIGTKMMKLSKDIAEQHYAVHKTKPFFGELIEFMTSSPIVVLAVEGPQAIDVVRKLMGATAGATADPGTIRGDFGLSNSYNLVHGSDALETAGAEIKLFFTKEELFEYSRDIDKWIAD